MLWVSSGCAKASDSSKTTRTLGFWAAGGWRSISLSRRLAGPNTPRVKYTLC